MQRGAANFLEKPLDEHRVLVTLNKALREETSTREQGAQAKAERRLRADGRLRRPCPSCALPSSASRTRTPRCSSPGRTAWARSSSLATCTCSATACGGPVHHRELRGHPGGAGGVRAVRPREGVLHRGSRGPGRALRGRRRRELFLDEVGDMPIACPGQGASRARDPRGHARRREPDALRRHPRRRRDERRPEPGRGGQDLPPRPLLPAQRGAARGPALRARPDDIGPIARHLLERQAERIGRSPRLTRGRRRRAAPAHPGRATSGSSGTCWRRPRSSLRTDASRR